jgi:hypothetical protein
MIDGEGPVLIDTHCWIWSQFGHDHEFSTLGLSTFRQAARDGPMPLGVSVEQAIKGGAHPVPARKLVEWDWIVSSDPQVGIFPWDLLKTIQEEVYSSLS